MVQRKSITMKAIRVFTIYHNNSDDKESIYYNKQIKLSLYRMADNSFEWCEDLKKITTGVSGTTVSDACKAAHVVWGSKVWV